MTPIDNTPIERCPRCNSTALQYINGLGIRLTRCLHCGRQRWKHKENKVPIVEQR